MNRPSLSQGLSLRQKLALLLSGISSAVVAAAVVLSYGEVRQAALSAAMARLDRVGHQLSDLAASSVEARGRLVAEVGQDASVSAALRGFPGDSAALGSTLERLRTVADSGLPIEL